MAVGNAGFMNPFPLTLLKNCNEKDMTQEEKKLVLIDLCGRLPYDIVINDEYGDYINVNIYNAHIEHLIDRVVSGLDKMMLRPMSSMTEKEEAEIANIIEEVYDFTFRTEELLEMIPMQKTFPMASIDWFYEKGFDIRGLIPKGLALEAPEGMYNK